MASDQCQAETNKGARCKRAATVTMKREWEEPVFFFFHKKVEKFDRYCGPHADKARVGVRVEEE